MKIKVFLFLLCFFLSGCALKKVSTSINPSDIKIFEVSGKIFISSKNRNHISNFNWKHFDEKEYIVIKSTLGTTVGILEINNSFAVLETPKRSYKERNIKILSKELFGWELPVKSLSYWIVGKLDPNYPTKKKKEPNVDTFQRNWKVSYKKFFKNKLPQIIYLKNNTISVKILIFDWISIN